MGRCPSCGARTLFMNKSKLCFCCGKEVCNKCVPYFHGTLGIKTQMEISNKPSTYENVGFCSSKCFYQFWDEVDHYPITFEIGTDICWVLMTRLLMLGTKQF